MRKPLKRPEHLLRRDLDKIPRADRVLDRLEQGVLADALAAAQHQRVVDLLLRALHPVREPMNDMIGVVGIDLAHMVEPRAGLRGVAGLDRRRPIEVETADASRSIQPPSEIRRPRISIGRPGAHVICSTGLC